MPPDNDYSMSFSNGFAKVESIPSASNGFTKVESMPFAWSGNVPTHGYYHGAYVDGLLKGPPMTPRRGAIAVNESGHLGLITRDKPEGAQWIGIHLSDRGEITWTDHGLEQTQFNIGHPWRSAAPWVIGYLGPIEL